MSLAIQPRTLDIRMRLEGCQTLSLRDIKCIFSESVGMPNLNIIRVFSEIIVGTKFPKGMPYFLRKFGRMVPGQISGGAK